VSATAAVAQAHEEGRVGLAAAACAKAPKMQHLIEQLLDQLAEEGADEAAKRYLIPNRAVAKGVQLRMLRQRVVMTAQKAQADVLLHRLHYALPGWGAAAERRDAQDELHSAARARARAGGGFDAGHGLASKNAA
jgi:hypothetical protein